MTNNQINFWNLKEKERTDRVQEQERRRNNLALERIQGRANDIKYDLGLQQNVETNRANLAKERENERNNKANNALSMWEKLIKEGEVRVASRNADTNALNAQTRIGELNLGYSTLGETQRSNLVREALQQENLELDKRKQDEVERYNLEEQNRRNFESASGYTNTRNSVVTGQKTQTENVRTHKANENITREKNLYDIELRSLGLQHDIEMDTAKFNQQSLSNLTNSFTSAGNSLGNLMKGAAQFNRR